MNNKTTEKNYQFRVKIWTLFKTIEWETNEISPDSLEEKVDIEEFDGDVVTKGEIEDLTIGQVRELSPDGYWNFVPKEENE